MTSTLRPLPNRARVLAMALAFVAGSMVCKLVPWFALAPLGERSLVRSVIAGAVSLGAVIAATWWLRRKRPEIGAPELDLLPDPRRGGAVHGGGGLLLGGAIYGVVFVSAWLLGGVSLAAKPLGALDVLGVALGLLVSIVVNAAWEEYTFRGWAFSACVRGFGPHRVAVGLGVVFGLAHLFNANWSFAAIASVSLAGLLLSYAMLGARRIDFPIGMHVGWNFAQATLTTPRLWDVTLHPDPMRSGGPWGLEASAPGIFWTGVAAAVALAVFLWKKRARPPESGQERAGESA